MRTLFFLTALALALAGCTPQPAIKADPEAARKGIEAALASSVEGWRTGRVERFLGIYSDAQDAIFVTDKGLVRGKPAMEKQYRAGYALNDDARRGDLKTQIIDFRTIDPDHSLAVVQFTLTPQSGPAVNGYSTLLFRKEGTEWKVIADHSS